MICAKMVDSSVHIATSVTRKSEVMAVLSNHVKLEIDCNKFTSHKLT